MGEIMCSHERDRLDLTRRDLSTLHKRGWLNDEVINCYVALLQDRDLAWRRDGDPGGRRRPRCHFFNTCFYNKLFQDSHKYTYLERWTRAKKLAKVHGGKTLFDSCDKIIAPIHKGNHWCCAVIDLEAQAFVYYDSFKSEDHDCLEAMKQFAIDEARTRENTHISDVESWPVLFPQDIPEQRNGWDCGVFAATYAEVESRRMGRPKHFGFDQRDMPDLRVRMCVELLDQKVGCLNKTNKPPTAPPPPAAPPPAAAAPAAAASQKPEVEKEEAQKQSTQQTWQTSTPPTRRAAARANQAFNTYASQEDDRCKFVAANGKKCHKESEFGERYCEKHIRMAEKMESQSQSQKQQPPPLPLARAKRNILSSDTSNNTEEERKALAKKINENAKLYANLFPPAMAPETNLSDETSCCHWCRGRSPVFAVCPNQGKKVKNTGKLPCPRVCPKCIYMHHSSLIDAWNIKTPEELKKRWIEFMKGGCPQCRAVCSCRICLRGVPGKQLDRDTGATALYYVNADGVIGELPPIPQGEKQAFAKHVAHALAATCVPRIARSAHEAAMVHQKLHALDQVAERTINAVGDGERAICSNPECGTSLWNDYYSAPATEKEIEAWQKQKEEEKAAKGGGKAAMAAAAPAAKGLYDDDDDDDDDDEEEEEEEEEGQGPPDTELCPDCFIRRVQAMQETMDADQEEVDFVKSLKRCGLEPASRFDAALQLPLPKHTEPATLPRLPLANKVLQRGERIADMPSICTPVSNINPGEEGSPEVDNTSNVVLASLPADAAKLHKNIFSPTMWQMRHGIEGEPEPSNLRTADGVKYGPQFVERTDPEMFAAFHKRWMQGEPILMRRCIGRMSWAPRVLRRMARESRPGRHDRRETL
ncbi:JmjC domain-containing protein [Pseudoscourfieldia marina]